MPALTANRARASQKFPAISRCANPSSHKPLASLSPSPPLSDGKGAILVLVTTHAVGVSASGLSRRDVRRRPSADDEQQCGCGDRADGAASAKAPIDADHRGGCTDNNTAQRPQAAIHKEQT